MAITPERLQAMVTHWLRTPVNSYSGSDYGSDLESLLHSPMASAAADALIAKLRRDIPIIGRLPSEVVNVYSERVGLDKIRFVFEVAGTFVQLDAGGRVVSQV